MSPIALMFFVALAAAPVPDGPCILLNGQLGMAEWTDGDSIRLDSETELRFHRDEQYLFLAIVFHGPRHTGVDLYLESSGITRMLHVSSALGERILEDGEWSDTVWGRNSWWSANSIGSIYVEGRQRFLEPDAFEFQMDRRELGEEIMLFFHLKRPEKSLPAGATAADRKDWIRLKSN